MEALSRIAEWHSLPQMGADLTQRWQALRNWSSYTQDPGWLWVVLAVGLCVLLLAVVLVAFFGPKPARKQSQKAFGDQAQTLGLNEAEQSVLAHIAILAGLKDSRAVFTMEQAVGQGARELLALEETKSLSPEQQKHLEAAVVSISQKLGFRSPLPSEAGSLVDTRQIPQGTRLLVIDEEGAVRMAATAVAVEPGGLVLMADSPLGLVPPARVLLRYGRQGTAHEFDCELETCHGPQARVKHAAAVRSINLRRYIRVPVDREAMVAELGFFQDGREMKIPSFSPARLLEIAGPGLLLRMPTRTQLADKVVVIAHLVDGTVIQAPASVRRAIRLEGGSSSVAVEMLDLGPQELAEMVRQTNLASRPQSADHGPSESAGQAPAALAAQRGEQP